MGQDSEAAPLGAATIDVNICAACGERHEELKLHPYVNAYPPFTHWYSCPTNTDPVPITVMMHNKHPVELNTRVMRDMLQAQLHGQAAFIVASVVSGRLIYNRHFMTFSREMMPVLAKQVAVDMEKELGVLPAPDQPLPAASVPNLFGAGIQSALSQQAPADVPAGSEEEAGGLNDESEQADG